MARLGALEQAIVPLGVKKPLFIKARLLKTVVNICGQDKVLPALRQRQQVLIDRLGGILITVHHDMTAPPGPVFLQRGERVKAAGVYITDAVFSGEISEIPLKPLPIIGQASRGGQPRPGADHDGVSLAESLF